MNDAVMDLLMDRMDRRDRRRDRARDRARDSEDMRRDRERDRRNRDNEYDEGYDYDERDYEDGRRGVKGSGRRDRADNRERGHSKLRLTKTDLKEWKHMMENADGTRGPHFDMQQIMQAADKHSIEFDEFSEAEFCTCVNMMYSDYCKTIKKYISPEKELAFCVELARDFLEDEDGPEPSEKIMLYYHCIVNA